MKGRALVVGSIAYDIIFSVHNKFKDEVVVLDNQIQDISIMLTANNKKVHFGGTGGNIAYGLGIQGESPILFSVVGDDFNHEYKAHLESIGVNLRVTVMPKEFTAAFYSISDIQKEQIGIFQPNTHGDYMHKIKLIDQFSQQEIESIKVAVFSPGTGESIKNHMKELRQLASKNVIIIFDPSQVLSIFFDKKLLTECISLSNIFIGNETEIQQLQSIIEKKLPEILELGLDYIIETKGSEGIIVYSKDREVKIPAIYVDNFVEQTGAGDAFRAGLIKGILNNQSIEDSCRLGAEIAAKSVQFEGGQNYKL